MVYYQYVMAYSKTRGLTIYHLRNGGVDPFDYQPHRDRVLELIGLVLWATEGDKTQLSLANGNPSIIKKYLEFLRRICNLREDKIKAVIHCHDTVPYQMCLRYWSEFTGIPPHRFTKPFIKPDKGGTRKYPHGILRITANNVRLVQLFKERLQTIGLDRH